MRIQLIYFVIERRENEQLSGYRDTRNSRTVMVTELKKLIEANPLFRDKLQFPIFSASRLRMLINQRYTQKKRKKNTLTNLQLIFHNQNRNEHFFALFCSLNWQHSLCPNPKRNPDIKTLFVDHICRNSGDSINANNQLTLGSSQQPRVDASFLAMGSNSGV